MSRGPKRVTARLFIRLEPSTLNKLRELAALEGRPMANLIRHLIDGAYGRAFHTDEPPHPKTEGDTPT